MFEGCTVYSYLLNLGLAFSLHQPLLTKTLNHSIPQSLAIKFLDQNFRVSIKYNASPPPQVSNSPSNFNFVSHLCTVAHQRTIRSNMFNFFNGVAFYHKAPIVNIKSQTTPNVPIKIYNFFNGAAFDRKNPIFSIKSQKAPIYPVKIFNGITFYHEATISSIKSQKYPIFPVKIFNSASVYHKAPIFSINSTRSKKAPHVPFKIFTGIAFYHKNPIFPVDSPKAPNSPIKNYKFQPSRTATDAAPSSRITRIGRADAQNALLDYLHSTRSFGYTDAEHVSRNSPTFLQSLLTRVEDDEDDDVGRSVTRFLRYNPINEFEPFLESLGLKPAELPPLLPHNLFFLSEDEVLLENYRVICNYGVPRSKIGRMFKEGMEMFGYGDGILISRLHAYERLGLSQPTIIKLVSCCPALLVGELNIEFLKVLKKLKGFGVELDWIKGCFSDKSMYDWDRILNMLNFLDGIGCSKDLAGLIKAHPRFVFDDSGMKIYLLVAVLLKLGLKRVDVLKFFENYPRLLTQNFVRNLWKSVRFLTEIGMRGEDIVGIVSSCFGVLGSAKCMRPKLVLDKLNISAEDLCEIIKKDPNKFSELATRRRKMIGVHLPEIYGTFLQEKTVFLLNIGFVENSEEMARALRKFRGRGDQLQERFDCLVKVGLDCHTVAGMIKLVPTVLSQSTDVIEKKLDYLLNRLGYPLESLVVFPTFLCYRLDKIKLRFAMYAWLKEKGVVIRTKNRKVSMSNVALSTLLACSDVRFLKFVVNLHPEGPQEWERLKNLPSSSSEMC